MPQKRPTLEEALTVLLKLHAMYESHGDAMSRYAHEVRTILRIAGKIPYPDGHFEVRESNTPKSRAFIYEANHIIKRGEEDS